jgi:hypothetical protein
MVVRPLIMALVAASDGDELEMDYALSADQPIFPHSTFLFPDGWWDAWKERALDEEGTVHLGDVYRHQVMPAVWEVLAQLPGPLQRVVDLGGGDGECLAAWLDLRPDIGDAALLDRNAPALELARGRLGGRARVVAHDLARTSAATLREAAGGPIDVVLAIGVLCVNVLTREGALRCAEAVAGALAPGGVAVLAGWTPALLRRSEWEALGLCVVNTTRPDSAEAWGGPQLYVLQRPA